MSSARNHDTGRRVSLRLTAGFALGLLIVSAATFLAAASTISASMQAEWASTRSGLVERWKGEPGQSAREISYWQEHDRAAPTPAIRAAVESHFRRAFATLAIPALVVVLLGGAALAWFATRPLTELERTARVIVETGDLKRRVAVPKGRGPIARLMELFNLLLERNDALLNSTRQTLDHLAHDLKTPLARLRGTAEREVGKEPSARSQDALVECIEEADHMSGLIERLMDLAEAEAGTMKLDRRPLGLREVVESAADLYELVAEEKEIVLQIEGEDCRVVGDRIRLRQVFANLLDNAIKFSPRGGRIRISLEARGKDALVAIQDEGPGVLPEDLDRIWDRLYRGDQSRSTPGLGLGLSIVRAVVHAHGGQVTVESTPGAGARFVVTLPAAA